MKEIRNTGTPLVEEKHHTEVYHPPQVTPTVVDDVKPFLTRQACHNCFKWVDDVRLSDVAKQLPICSKCEEKRRSNLSADLREGTINPRAEKSPG